MARWIGELDDAHLAAGAGAALEPRYDRAGDPTAARARLHGTDKLRPGLNPQPLERTRIIVERMAGQKEADRLELLLQSFGREPSLNRWQGERRTRHGA